MNTPTLTVDVVADLVCPWCYIGKRKLEAALALPGAADLPNVVMRWLAFQLNPDIPAQGIPRQQYLANKLGGPERTAEIYQQVHAAGQTVGLELKLDGIAPKRRGEPQIEVTFDIDANGILHVSAKDLGTGKEQKITITASSGLSKEEVEKMRRDAEAHAEEDKAKREEIETRNETDSVVYRSEKLIKDNGDKLDSAAKSKIEDAVKQAREALSGTDADKIREARDKLNEAVQAASEQLYKAAAEKAQAGKAAGPASGGEAKSDKDEGPVIDAEVVDEKKK